MILVAQRRGNHLDVLSFDASQDGALASWEDVLGNKRVTTLHKNDDSTDKVREVQLNPDPTASSESWSSMGRPTS